MSMSMNQALRGFHVGTVKGSHLLPSGLSWTAANPLHAFKQPVTRGSYKCVLSSFSSIPSQTLQVPSLGASKGNNKLVTNCNQSNLNPFGDAFVSALTFEGSKKFEINYDIIYDEASRLMKEMETTIKEMEESRLYGEMAQQLRSDPTIQSNLRRMLGSSSHVTMVIYALGSIELSYNSQYQLAIAILLKRDFSHWIGDIEVFDPIMSPVDVIVLKQLGCNVLTVNEECRRQVKRPTFFYMTSPTFNLVGNLMAANWCPSCINQMFVLTRSYEWTMEHLRESGLYKDTLQYMEGIQEHTTEVDIQTSSYDIYKRFFYAYAWHFFDVGSNIDMETLLSAGLKPMVDEQKEELEMEREEEDEQKEELVMERREEEDEQKEDLEMERKEEEDEQKEDLEMERKEEPLWLKLLTSVDDSFVKAFIENEDHDCLWVDGGYRAPRWFRLSSRPPPPDWVKLNISGKGYNDQSPAGFGGVFHDENKEPQAIFNGSLGKQDDVFANLFALNQGLMICRQHMPHVRRLIVECDDLTITRWANKLPEPPERYWEPLVQNTILLEYLEYLNFKIYHIEEEANLVAEYLAKKGAMRPFIKIWIAPFMRDGGYMVPEYVKDLQTHSTSEYELKKGYSEEWKSTSEQIVLGSLD